MRAEGKESSVSIPEPVISAPACPVPIMRLAPENTAFHEDERVYPRAWFCSEGLANCRMVNRVTVPVSLAVQENPSQYPVCVLSPTKVMERFAPPVARNSPVEYIPQKPVPVAYIPEPVRFSSTSVKRCSKSSFLFWLSRDFSVVILLASRFETNTVMPVMRMAESVTPRRSSMSVNPFLFCGFRMPIWDRIMGRGDMDGQGNVIYDYELELRNWFIAS